MAKTETLVNLRTAVRLRTDTVDDTHITDAFLNDVINEGYFELYDRIVEATGGQPYYLTSTNWATVSGTELYNINSDLSVTDYYKFYALDAKIDGTNWEPVERIPFQNRVDWSDSLFAERLYGRIFYALVGENIYITPTPDKAVTMRLWYIPTPTTLSADGDTLDGFAGWEAFIKAHASIQVRIRQEKSTAEYQNEKDRQMERVLRAVQQRDILGVKRIADVWSGGG